MQDFCLIQDENGLFDLRPQKNKKLFESVNGFETVLTLQVFTDKRTTKDDISDPIKRQGWIGDLLTKPDYEIGSLLYLKNQSRDTQKDRNEVKAFIEDSMKYFIQIKMLKKVIIELVGNSFNAVLYKSENILEKFNKLWQGTENINV